MLLSVVSVSFGLVGIGFGLHCYRELWKWARDCQNARIAIAYNRKVQLQAPLVEWLLWTRRVGDKGEHGHTVYHRNKVSVAIVRAQYPEGKVRAAIRSARGRRKTAPPPSPGKWTATDQTKRSPA